MSKHDLGRTTRTVIERLPKLEMAIMSRSDLREANSVVAGVRSDFSSDGPKSARRLRHFFASNVESSVTQRRDSQHR
jgi:hypothetical protein